MQVPDLPRNVVPRHVALVMDGNGRWATERGLPRTRGHEAGEDALFDDLEARHAGLRGRLVDDSGLRRFVNVYLNDEDVRFRAGIDTPVADGDTVTVLPAVAGG